MRVLISLILWCLLFALCWPLALLVFFLFPLLWLILIPFKIIGFTLDMVLKLISAILMFPFRVVRSL